MDPEVQQAIDGWGQSLASGTSAIIVAGYKLVDLLQREHEARTWAEEDLRKLNLDYANLLKESNEHEKARKLVGQEFAQWKLMCKQAIRQRDEVTAERDRLKEEVDELTALVRHVIGNHPDLTVPDGQDRPEGK